MAKKTMPKFVTDEQPQSSEAVEKFRRKAKEAKELTLVVEELEQRLAEASGQLHLLLSVELPDLMDEAGIDHIGVPAEGNYPAFDAKLKPDIRANIAANWPPEKRQEAFNWLDKNGHGDLIKTTFEIYIPREDRKLAKKIRTTLKKLKVTPEVTEAVNHQTLSAWLREMISDKKLPPLEIIGGYVGRIVKLKERKDG